MLQVILGIIFILLVLSLFATTLMEIANSVFSLRGKYLLKGVRQMLANSGRTDILESFLHNSRYNQLSSKFLFIKRPPSYISSKAFSSILMNVLDKEQQGNGKFDNIRDEHLREMLLQFEQESGGELHEFKQKLEDWYDEVMDRAKGWFKRNNQMWLILLGLGIAIVFDADTISIFQNLSNNPEAQLKLASMANEYFFSSNVGDSTQVDSLSLLAYRQELHELVTTNMESLREPLGLGWYYATNPSGLYGWFMKFLGWVITALAISLGAPFWFDLLKKVMNISNSGGLSKGQIVQQIMPLQPPTQMNHYTTGVLSPTPPSSIPASKGEDNIVKSYG